MKIEITDNLINFLRENQDLIAEGDFEELYQKVKRTSGVLPFELTNLLIESDIEFLHWLSRIPEYCFEYLPIESITIPNNIHAIEVNAFAGSSLTSIEIPDSVISGAEGIFTECVKLQSAVLPNSWKEIPESMFRSCVQLVSVQFPPNLKTVEQMAFYRCALTTLDLPESVTLIDSAAFASTPITEVKLPIALTKLRADAFADCSELQSVIFNTNIKSIGERVFFNCEKLTDITYTGTIEQWKKVRINKNNRQLFSLPIHCLDGDYAFDTTPTTPTTPRNILKFIKDHAAEIQTNDFDKIYLDAQSINKSKSFAIVPQITDFFYKSGVDPLQYLSYVPPYFLRGPEPVPTVLKNIVLSSKIESIGTAAFRYAKGIESVEILGNTAIGPGAFVDSPDIQRITFGPGVSKINGGAFNANPQVRLEYIGTTEQFLKTKITGYPGRRWVGDENAVVECSNGVVTFKDVQERDLQNIMKKYKHLIDNRDLDAVIEKMQDSGAGALPPLLLQRLAREWSTDPLASIQVLPYGYGDYSLDKEVTIPRHIKYVQTSFCNCPNLEKVTFEGVPEEIQTSCFDNCPRLKSIYFAGTVNQWEGAVGEHYFYSKDSGFGHATVYCSDGSVTLDPSDRKTWIPVGE